MNAGKRYRSCIFTPKMYTMPIRSGAAANTASFLLENSISPPQAAVAITGAVQVSKAPLIPPGSPHQLRPIKVQKL